MFSFHGNERHDLTQLHACEKMCMQTSRERERERERERDVCDRGIVNLFQPFLILASPFSSGPNDCCLLNAHANYFSKITDP